MQGERLLPQGVFYVMGIAEETRNNISTMFDFKTDCIVPEGFFSNLSYKEPVTMFHLMNHTAGFQETMWDVEVTDKEKIISLKDALISTAPAQIYEPGTVVSYSNWGAALAA